MSETDGPERDPSTGEAVAGESSAVESLRELGLSKYEAQVFIALQKLGTGTASDVDRIADVPRSQVYGAAESLEEQGLVEVQQSNPIHYRAVDLDEAREILRERFEREQDRAFDYLERTSDSLGGHDEEHEDGVWTVHGSENVATRVEQLVADAEQRVIYTAPESLLEDAVVDTLLDRADELPVIVYSYDDAVLDRFADVETVETSGFPEELAEKTGGRLLAIDGDTILMSIRGADQFPGGREETAIWSSETGFATFLLELTRSHLGDAVEGPL